MKKILSFLKKFAFHPNPTIRLLITISYTIFGLIGNFYLLQVFCMPIWWAAIWSIIVFIVVAGFPFIKNRNIRKTGYFILGFGVPAFLYMIIFLADPWEGLSGYLGFTLMILLLGLGLLAFIPLYYLYHTFQYLKKSSKSEKIFFTIGIIIPIIALTIFSIRFKIRYDSIYNSFSSSKVFDVNIAKAAKKDYFTERILGIGFLYHTKLEYVYDGARPPLHDPFLNVCLWFNRKGRNNPYYHGYLGLPISLKLKQQYYHYIFPSNPMKASCPCSFNRDGMSYFKN